MFCVSYQPGPSKKGTLSLGLDRTVASNVLLEVHEVGWTRLYAVSSVRIICLSTATNSHTEWFSLASVTTYMPAPPPSPRQLGLRICRGSFLAEQ